MPIRASLVFAAIILAITAPSAAAFPDDLDGGFGANGGAVVQVGSGGSLGLGATLDGDKVVVVGRMDDAGLVKAFIGRVGSNGQLDGTFAGDGVQEASGSRSRPRPRPLRPRSRSMPTATRSSSAISSRPA